MIKKELIILLLLLNQTTTATHKTNCIQKLVTKLDTKIKLSNKCKIISAPYLKFKYKKYPLLRDNPRKVQFWDGGYSRKVTTTTFYLDELIDKCDKKIMRSEYTTNRSILTLYFKIENPNLSPLIDESYMLSPLTKDEAINDMKRQEIRCQRYSVENY